MFRRIFHCILLKQPVAAAVCKADMKPSCINVFDLSRMMCIDLLHLRVCIRTYLHPSARISSVVALCATNLDLAFTLLLNARLTYIESDFQNDINSEISIIAPYVCSFLGPPGCFPCRQVRGLFGTLHFVRATRYWSLLSFLPALHRSFKFIS